MREITQEVATELFNKYSNQDPRNWNQSEAKVFIDNGRLIFQCDDDQDAERMFFAFMAVISSGPPEGHVHSDYGSDLLN